MQIAKTYEVFYGKRLIGKMYMESDTKYQYIPEEDVNDNLYGLLKIFPELTIKSEIGDRLPILEDRLNDSKIFGENDVISLHTDGIVLKKVQ